MDFILQRIKFRSSQFLYNEIILAGELKIGQG
jgi:hypothetical protein